MCGSQGIVDDMLPLVMIDTLQLGFVIIGALVLVILAAWPVIIVLVPLTVAFFWYGHLNSGRHPILY
jgi:hypothetical protein